MKHVTNFPLELELEDEDYVFDENDTEEAAEVKGLVRQRPSAASFSKATTGNNQEKTKIRRSTRYVFTAVVVVLAFLTFLWTNKRQTPTIVSMEEKDVELSRTCLQDVQPPVIISEGVLHFTCPCENPDATNSHVPSKKINPITNLTKYLQVFRDLEFDAWGHSFSEVKKGLYDWKTKQFARYLHDNATIYESSCGLGMNLFMTLEILKEAKGLRNLVVYGNDNSTNAVQTANELAHRGALPAGGQLGTICQADSNHLWHVPDNSFDLVFTSYLAPLSDPLGLGSKDYSNVDVRNAYTALCDQLNDEEALQKKREAQRLQNKWFAHWFGEMIRIAKPGAPVIAEQISFPLCESPSVWGGVSQDFWAMAAENHKWDIDTKSITFETDRLLRHHYHVFMRKNKKRSS